MKKLKVYTIRLLGIVTVLLWSSNITFNSFDTKSSDLSVRIDEAHHKKYQGESEKLISQSTNKDNLFKDSSEDDTPIDYLDFGCSGPIWKFVTYTVFTKRTNVDYSPIFYKIPLWIQHQRIII